MRSHSSYSDATRYLFATWEGGGVVAPAITVAKKLMERGHKVRMMCDDASRAEIEAAGLEFRPWRLAPNRKDRTRENDPMKDWEAANPQEGIMRMFHHVMIGPAMKYACDVLAELDCEPADVVVTSDMLPGVMAACESRGQRFAVFAANLNFYPIPGMHAFGPGLPPPKSPEEEAMHNAIKAGTIAMCDTGLDLFNQARAALGLKPIEHVTDQIYAAQHILLATSRAFDFPLKQLPERIHYVGPQLGHAAPSSTYSLPWPASDHRPLIAVGFSTTFQDHAGALQKIVDATAELPVRTLITLGQIKANEVKPANNTVLVTSAPHDAVMREASVVVTHGGHGTVMRALVHQRPMLIIPHGRDQNENAIRVTERGAGLCLPAMASREEIGEAIRRLLEDPSFANAAGKLGKEVAEEMNHSPVVELLEELAMENMVNRR